LAAKGKKTLSVKTTLSVGWAGQHAPLYSLLYCSSLQSIFLRRDEIALQLKQEVQTLRRTKPVKLGNVSNHLSKHF